MTRDELRATWIRTLREQGDNVVDPWLLAYLPVSVPRRIGVPWKQMVQEQMGLVDLQGHERGEPLGQSLADLYELKGYTAAQIAEELESGRYWAEWPEEEGR